MIPVRLSFFCVMLAYSNLIPLPALRVIFLNFPLKQTFVFPPLRDWMYKDVTLASFHSMSTMKLHGRRYLSRCRPSIPPEEPEAG